METLRVLRNTNLCQSGEILLIERNGGNGENYRCFRTKYDVATNKMVKRGKPFMVPSSAFSAPEQPEEIDHADDEETAAVEEQPKAEGTAADQS